MQQAGAVSPLSVTVLLLSLSYPSVVLAGLAQLIRPRNARLRNLPYWFAAVFMFVHVLIVSYLATYGVLGIRTWA